MSEINVSGCRCNNASSTRQLPSLDEHIERQRKVWDELEADITESVLRQVRLEFGDKLEERETGGVEELGLCPHDTEVVGASLSACVAQGDVIVVGLLDLLRDLIEAIRVDQNTSPSRSGLSADTLSSPTMTVSENTSAGAVSPSVPAHPRFVAVGACVYDRAFDRVSRHAVSSRESAALLAERLNAGNFPESKVTWEDAK